MLKQVLLKQVLFENRPILNVFANIVGGFQGNHFKLSNKSECPEQNNTDQNDRTPPPWGHKKAKGSCPTQLLSMGGQGGLYIKHNYVHQNCHCPRCFSVGNFVFF